MEQNGEIAGREKQAAETEKRRKKSPLLTISSILCLLDGVMTLIILLVLITGVTRGMEPVGDMKEMLILMGYLAASAVLMLLAGTKGLKARGSYVLGVLLLLVGVGSMVASLSKGDAAWLNWVELLLPALYLVGVKASR